MKVKVKKIAVICAKNTGWQMFVKSLGGVEVYAGHCVVRTNDEITSYFRILNLEHARGLEFDDYTILEYKYNRPSQELVDMVRAYVRKR